MAATWYPQLATLPQIVEIFAGDDKYRHSWPPPGTMILPVAHPEPWGLVVETGDIDTQHIYWTSLQEFVTDVPGWAADIMFRVAEKLVGPIAAVISSAGEWPVLWDATGGKFMRWIRITHRGIYGANAEQFQFKLDYGNPGDDPELDEEDAMALATGVATIFKTEWSRAGAPAGKAIDVYYNAMEWVEIGAVEMTKSAGDKVKQSYPTAWYAWSAASRPKGVGSPEVMLPYEVAFCVSHNTDYRGPSGRGRCYLPGPMTSALSSGGLFNSDYVGTAGGFVARLANAVKAAHPTYKPVVVSPHKTQLHAITTFTAGKVPDAQRRRRRNLDEAKTNVGNVV